jgi:hypothetical protein
MEKAQKIAFDHRAFSMLVFLRKSKDFLMIQVLRRPQLLFFQRDLSDRLLDPLRWCGQKYYSQMGSDEAQGTMGSTCQLVQKIIARILLMPAIVCAGLLGVAGSLMKVFQSPEPNPIEKCIIANIPTQHREGVLRNACVRLQIPPDYEWEEVGYDGRGELRPHHRITEATARLIATVNSNTPGLFPSVHGSNYPNYPFSNEIRKSAKQFTLKVAPHFWNQFVHYLSSSFNQDPARRITDPISLNYSMIATQEEAAKWRHVLDLILGIPQIESSRDQASKMLQLCQTVELYISDDLEHFRIISYGAV